LWLGIRFAKPAGVSKKQLLAGGSLGAEGPSCAMKPVGFDSFAFSQT